MGQIKDEKVLVTGANRGIGLAIAIEFAKAGARVLLGARDWKSKESVAALDEVRSHVAKHEFVEPFQIDLGSRDAIEDALKRLVPLEIDILVNNAGQLTGGLLEEQSLDEIYSMYQVNLVGLTHLTRGVIPGMVQRGHGKIVNNSSVSGVMNFPMASTYSASKTGVVALTACLANELRGTGVSTLTVLTPGVKTRMFDEIAVKYGNKMDLKFLEGAVAPEVWSREIVEAVADDREVLNPEGATAMGLWLARHTPSVFNKIITSRFRRSGFVSN